MIINSAKLNVLKTGQMSYEVWFLKSGQVVSYYRMPRSDLEAGIHDLSYSSGKIFPFEADNAKIESDFVTNENILILNSNKQITMPISGKTKMVGFGLSLLGIVVIAGLGYLAYHIMKKR